MPSSSYRAIRSQEQRKRRNRRFVLELLFLIVLSAAGIALGPSVKGMVKSKLLSSLEMKPGSSALAIWLDPPISTKRSYHLFNISNEKEVLTKPSTAPLHLTDSPAYVYEIKTSKKNLRWAEGNRELSYEVERLITRDKKAFKSSTASENGTFVDMMWGTFRAQFGKKPAQALYDLAGPSPLYHRHPIEQLEGFSTPLFERIQEKMVGPNKDKYGYVYRQNGSRLYNVTITTDLLKKGQLLSYASELSSFRIDSAAYYNFPVYDGLTFPPLIFDKPSIDIFNSDFCRPIRIEYNSTVSKFGFSQLHKYLLKLIDFSQCTDANDTRSCPEVDRLDVSKCFSDSLPANTILLSKAHFYGSSEETIQEMKLTGLTPNAEEHESVIYFEPNTGTPIQGIYRIQLNLNTVLNPLRWSDEESRWEPIANARGTVRILPVFWIEQKIDVSFGTIIKLRIVTVLLSRPSWLLVPLAIGFGLLVIVIVELCARRVAKH